jgi:hypothetical protein
MNPIIGGVNWETIWEAISATAIAGGLLVTLFKIPWNLSRKLTRIEDGQKEVGAGQARLHVKVDDVLLETRELRVALRRHGQRLDRLEDILQLPRTIAGRKEHPEDDEPPLAASGVPVWWQPPGLSAAAAR